MSSSSTDVECHKLNLVSLNVRGLGNKCKRITLFNWLKRKYKDCIILLQETHSTQDIEKQWQDEWGSHIEFSHFNKQSRGVAILFNKQANYEIVNTCNDNEGRFLLVELLIEDQPFSLCNIYAPTKDAQEEQAIFFKFILDTLFDHVGENLILGGDFNVCMYPIDKQGGRDEAISNSAKKIFEIQEMLSLVDAWRTLNENVKRFTWRGKTKRGLVASRIDFFLISKHLLPCVHEIDILPSIKTDHSLIHVSLSIVNSIARGKGYWKFNVALLKDKVYIRKINSFLDTCTDKFNYMEDKGKVWDIMKCEIRGITLKYSINKRKREKQEQDELNKQLLTLQIRLDKGEEVNDLYNDVQNRIIEFEEEAARGIIIRSRARWIEHGERPTKYFMNLEKQNSKLKSMNILNIGEKSITDHLAIQQECIKFYKALYADGKNDNNFQNCSLFEIDYPTLTEEQSISCEGIVSIDECAISLKELSNNRSPGIDGIPVEFYKFFWQKIKNHLVESFHFALQSGHLSLDQRRAILTLIPKGNKDSRLLKNWRPLSILNSDYKVLAKILSKRLQTVIPNLIHSDQVGYIKGRFIGDNIRTLLDIFEITKDEKDPGIIVLIDFLKAFDSISWQFLHKTLEVFNFGETFRKFIKVLYNKPLCCISNNGHHTEYFEISRGIRQGCPISALLFILCVEILALNIRQNNNINGITISDKELKLSQYADDTCLYLKNVASLEHALDTFEEFYRYAGLRLNKEKTEMIWLGTQTRTGKCSNINFTSNPVKVLGIWVCKNPNELINININERFHKFKILLNMWKSRNLSLKGKITILSSQALPLLLFATTFLFISNERIAEIEGIMYNFIWPKGKHHVKKRTLIEDIKNGGLNMPDLDSKIKAMKFLCIKRLLVYQNSCTATAKHFLKTNNLERFFSYKQHTDTFQNLPPYYKQLLEIWSSVHNSKPNTAREIKSEIIWNNAEIMIGGKSIYLDKWKRQGILYINDIIDKNNGNNFKSLVQIFNEYGIRSNFLTYEGIKRAVPREWVNTLRLNQNNNDNENLIDKEVYVYLQDKKLCARKTTCKDIYRHLINIKGLPPTSHYQWEAEFFYNQLDWSEINNTPYKSVRETSIQCLQYKIINNFYPCQSVLFLWKKSDSDKCKYCDLTDTIRHHFIDCNRVQRFWTNLRTWLIDNLEVNIPLSPCEIIFGIQNYHNNDIFNTINFLLLYGKYFIQNQNYKNSILNFTAFLNIVKHRLKAEKLIYQMCGEFEKYERKWGEVDNALN